MDSAYARIARHLSDWIRRNAAPGNRLPPEPQLAKRFGVSVGTIRRAIGILVEQRRLQRVQGSGTYVLKDPKHTAVLMAVSSLTREHDFQRPLAGHLLRMARERGQAAQLYITDDLQNMDGQCEELDRALGSDLIHAVACLPAYRKPDWSVICEQNNIPVLQHNPRSGGPGTVTDYASWMRMAVDALVRAGRRRIAFISWHDSARWGPQDRRKQLFLNELKRHDLEFNQAWERHDLSPHQPTAGWEEFREIWSSSRTRPDGVVITDEVLYRQASQAIMSLGLRVPEELTVVTQEVVGSNLFCPFPTGRLAFNPADFAAAMLDLTSRFVNEELAFEPTASFAPVWLEQVTDHPIEPVHQG